MDLATKSSDGNFYEKSRVDFRLKELKREAEILLKLKIIFIYIFYLINYKYYIFLSIIMFL